MNEVHEMKTKFELTATCEDKTFAPLTFELDGKFTEDEWNTFRTILPMFISQASEKQTVMDAASKMAVDVEVTSKEAA